MSLIQLLNTLILLKEPKIPNENTHAHDNAKCAGHKKISPKFPEIFSGRCGPIKAWIILDLVGKSFFNLSSAILCHGLSLDSGIPGWLLIGPCLAFSSRLYAEILAPGIGIV